MRIARDVGSPARLVAMVKAVAVLGGALQGAVFVGSWVDAKGNFVPEGRAAVLRHGRFYVRWANGRTARVTPWVSPAPSRFDDVPTIRATFDIPEED